jgi:EmrB/QacA subfamily drug resistance transporter
MLTIEPIKRHAALAAVFIAAFSLVLMNSSFNILLPSFMQLYGISATSAGWVILSYLLSMTVTMPLTPLIVDRLGRKRAYIAGVAVYGLSSIIGGLFVQYVQVILIVRCVHGIAGGIMIPLSLSLLFDVYEQEVHGRVAGVWGIQLTIASIIGPTLGGLVIQFGELQYLFWMNVPFAIVSLFLCATQIDSYKAMRKKEIDVLGIIFLVLSICMLSVSIQLLLKGIIPIWVLVIMLIGGFLLLIRFIQLENKKIEPLLNYKLLRRNKIFAITVLISVIQDVVMLGAIFVLPLLFQEVFHLPSSLVGAMFIPTAIFTSLFMWLGGFWMDRGKSKNFIVVGIIIVALSILSFSLLPSSVSLVVLIILMIGRGIGGGLSNMTVTTIGLHTLSQEELHEGSALASTIERFSSSFAVMLLTIYYEFRWNSLANTVGSLADAKWMALKEECMILGCIMLVTVPFVLYITRKRVDIGGH